MEGELRKRQDRYFLVLENGVLFNGYLSLKNCQAIERGYDLDELADEIYNGHVMAVDWQLEKQGFKQGFQKCLEILGDKKFTEEDIKKAILFGDGIDWFDEDGNQMISYIQSLQKTEWDVTFDYDELDQDGCIILKINENSHSRNIR